MKTFTPPIPGQQMAQNLFPPFKNYVQKSRIHAMLEPDDDEDERRQFKKLVMEHPELYVYSAFGRDGMTYTYLCEFI